MPNPIALLVVLFLGALALLFGFNPDIFGGGNDGDRDEGYQSDTFERLVDLCDSREAAVRLVRQVQTRYPDRSYGWCCEKALFDLERDRNI
ncbi:MAG: hypothetical protein AAFY15_02395 [Cyanobacteria bacterium J06648_11]